MKTLTATILRFKFAVRKGTTSLAPRSVNLFTLMKSSKIGVIGEVSVTSWPSSATWYGYQDIVG